MVIRTVTLFAVVAPLFLAACDNSPSPLAREPQRTGAEKSVPVGQRLPPPAQHQYEPGIAPANEEKGLKVGEVVGGAGGQRAQKEKERKEQAAVEAEQARQRAELARQLSADDKTSTQ